VIYRTKFSDEKSEVPGLCNGKNSMILRSLVSTQYQRVTDIQPDGAAHSYAMLLHI